MTSRPALVMLGLCTTVLVLAALYFARSILAPVAFSLFVIAIVWPLQRVLQARMPALLALLATLVVTLVVMTVLGGLIAWSFGTVGRWLIDNAAKFQLLYMQLTEWLEGHGILLTSLLVDNFNASWLIRAVQEIGAQIHGLLSFTIITFVFTVLGLLEVEVARTNIESLRNRETAHTILQSSERIADKFQKYMLVRSIMSVLTGAVVWGFALLAGLELATAWGVIAFVLNYIPFIGPLVATVFPTLFALAQFEVLATGHHRVPLPEPDPVSDRQLPRTPDRRRRPRRVAVPGAVRGVLLGLPLGHPGRVHRRADRDRDPHRLRAARIHALGRDAAVGPQGQGSVARRQHLRGTRLALLRFCNVGSFHQKWLLRSAHQRRGVSLETSW